ncbi:aldo/keto reductase [Streptomyces sp. NPDC090088]|uniref:aldo/keto reductase n=1 Tax=Streptomyces sp. NPDC090088 TaxID=3365944 RepID=UPI0037F36C9D
MTPVTDGTARPIPRVALHDGTSIPQMGFGTLNTLDLADATAGNPDDAGAARTISLAIDAGYRHFDSAQGYMSEAGVGMALRESGLPREDFYVTSKLANNNHRPDDVRRSFDQTMDQLGLPYLDLFLMHWPLPTRYDGDYVSTWRAMAELLADGRVRSIGVSNFQPAHLDRIISETGIIPVVNQVEMHPKFANAEVRAACARYGIAIEAWAPLAQGRYLDDPVIGRIAAEVGRTPAQVMLRWHIEQGNIIFPMSSNSDRMRQNLAVLDFELTGSHHGAISALDQGEAGRNGPHPDKFDWIPETAS